MTAIENKGGIKKEKEYKGDIKKEKEYKGEKKCIKEKEKVQVSFYLFSFPL